MTPIPLTPHPRGVVITVRAVPRAGRSGIAGLRGDALLVRLAAAPVEGAANDELVAVVAKVLRVPKRQVSVLSGEHAREKRVLVEGVSPTAVQQQLSDILGRA